MERRRRFVLTVAACFALGFLAVNFYQRGTDNAVPVIAHDRCAGVETTTLRLPARPVCTAGEAAASVPARDAAALRVPPAPRITGELLAVRETPPDAAGRFQRVKVIKQAAFKYPLLRVEETVVRAPLEADEIVVRREEMVADHLMIRLREGATEKDLRDLNAAVGARIRKKLRTDGPGLYLVELPQVAAQAAEQPAALNVDAVPEAVAFYGQAARVVAYAEPDYLVHTCETTPNETTPNDPDFNKLWGLHNTGQTGGTAGVDIKALGAWQYTTGSKNVLVGVIDTGIDYTHPDLAANMWTNPGETGLDANGNDKRFNGIDDDGNGYVDDWRGWNFITETNDPMDDHWHGTHCAGTIGATGNNGVGVVGVCWNVSLVGLKFLSSGGSGTNSDAAEAVAYATKIGVHLTSNSWGGGSFTQSLKDAITAADAKGILFVAAAGNNRENTDYTPYYPAGYGSPNIISVAATDHNDALASFSNYGATSVDLGAPGVNVFSTKLAGTYGAHNGTSMATPHVSGVCALFMARALGFSHTDVKARLLAKTDPVAALNGKCVTGGRLNAFKTVQISLNPWLCLAKAAVSDVTGNGDGLINPGETADLVVTVKNIGLNPAVGVNAALTTTDAYVTVLDAAAVFGDIAGYESEKTAADPFRIKVDAACPTPHEVTFALEITSGDGTSWTDSFKVMVYTSSQISGTATLDGAPLSGATIAYTGPLSGTATTGSDGKYLFGGIAGTYTLTASKGTYLASAPMAVTVPPSKTGVNFAFTTATVSGKVTDADTGAAVAGATVEYAGPLSGAMTTAADGTYAVTRVYGQTAALTLTAKKPGVYFDSAPKSVTVPPHAPNTNFQLEVPNIAVTPNSLGAEVVLGQAVTRTLTIANTGSKDLEWSSWIQMSATGVPIGEMKRQWVMPTEVGNPFGVVSDGAVLWVSNYSTSKLYKLDLLNGHVTGILDVEAVCKKPWGLAWDGAKLWIVDSDNGMVFAVDPTTGAKLMEFAAPIGSYPRGLSFGGGALWLVSDWERKIYKLNAKTGAVLSSMAVPSAVSGSVYDVAHLNNALWVVATFSGDGKVYKVNPTDGAVLGSFVGPDSTIFGMANAGGGALWLSSLTNKRASLVDTGEMGWMPLAPESGTVAAKSSVNVTVTMDSTRVATIGKYQATIRVLSNDPDSPDVPVATTMTVIHALNNPPVIDSPPVATPNPATVGQTVSFSVAASNADGDVLTYAWNFGDGNTGNGETPTHIYNAAGTFTATVMVSDGKGGSASGSVTVTVNPPANQAPTVTTAAKATPSPATGTTTVLSVLGADDGGEANLTYTWATTGTPPAAVSFSPNGTNAAKNSTATFTKAGSYSFQVTIKDAGNLTVTSSVNVTVNQTLTSIAVSPTSASVNTGATQQFTATAKDQFSANLTTQPTFSWTVSGGGTISSAGLFTAGSTAGGPYTVTASSGGKSGTAFVTVQAGSTPGLVKLVARDQNGITPAGTIVKIKLAGVWNDYPSGTDVQLTVGTKYELRAFVANITGASLYYTVTAGMTEIALPLWKATVRCRNQHSANVPEAKVYIANVTGSPFVPGTAITLPKGYKATVHGWVPSVSGPKTYPIFTDGYTEIAPEFWTATVRCRDQFGANVAEAKANISNVTGTPFVPGTAITLPKGYKASLRGWVPNVTGPYTYPIFTDGYTEIAPEFTKVTVRCRDQNNAVVPSGTGHLRYIGTEYFADGATAAVPTGATISTRSRRASLYADVYAGIAFNSTAATFAAKFRSVTFKGVASDGTTLVPNAEVEIYGSGLARFANGTAQASPEPDTLRVRIFKDGKVIGDVSGLKVTATTTELVVTTSWVAGASAPLGVNAEGEEIGAGALTPNEPLVLSKTAVKLNFGKTGSDQILVSGVLPITEGYAMEGQTLTVNFGGVEETFILNGRGQGKTAGANERFRLQIKRKKGVVVAQQAKFQLQLKNGDFAQALSAAGLTNADHRKAAVTVPVLLTFDGTTYAADKQLLFSAKADKTGLAK